jgi:hypothetical protein
VSEVRHLGFRVNDRTGDYEIADGMMVLLTEVSVVRVYASGRIEVEPRPKIDE